MSLRTTLATAALISLPVAVQAEHPLCCKLFGHHHSCCSDCQVHVHYCQPPAEEYAAPMQQPAVPQVSQQLLYTPVLPSAVGFTMPMMPMMQMGMMPSYAMQPQAYSAPLPASAPMPQSAPRAAAEATACGGCELRVARLEDGVKNLNERMDRIEVILENQTRALEGILKEKQSQNPNLAH